VSTIRGRACSGEEYNASFHSACLTVPHDIQMQIYCYKANRSTLIHTRSFLGAVTNVHSMGKYFKYKGCNFMQHVRRIEYIWEYGTKVDFSFSIKFIISMWSKLKYPDKRLRVCLQRYTSLHIKDKTVNIQTQRPHYAFSLNDVCKEFHPCQSTDLNIPWK
jgi:hypothetical protein